MRCLWDVYGSQACPNVVSWQAWRGRGGSGISVQASPHSSIAVSPAPALAALLMAVRVVLLKVLLSDAVLTSILLAQS